MFNPHSLVIFWLAFAVILFAITFRLKKDSLFGACLILSFVALNLIFSFALDPSFSLPLLSSTFLTDLWKEVSRTQRFFIFEMLVCCLGLFANFLLQNRTGRGAGENPVPFSKAVADSNLDSINKFKGLVLLVFCVTFWQLGIGYVSTRHWIQWQQLDFFYYKDLKGFEMKESINRAVPNNPYLLSAGEETVIPGSFFKKRQDRYFDLNGRELAEVLKHDFSSGKLLHYVKIQGINKSFCIDILGQHATMVSLREKGNETENDRGWFYRAYLSSQNFPWSEDSLKTNAPTEEWIDEGASNLPEKAYCEKHFKSKNDVELILVFSKPKALKG